MNKTENCLRALRQKTIIKYLDEGEKAVPITGYEDYFATTKGRIFSSKINFSYKTLENEEYVCIVWKELKPYNCHQYKAVSLSKKGVGKKNFYVHKLVYESFYGFYDTTWWKIYFRDMNTHNCVARNLGLRFRYKSKKKLEEYQRQQRILQVLT